MIDGWGGENKVLKLVHFGSKKLGINRRIKVGLILIIGRLKTKKPNPKRL